VQLSLPASTGNLRVVRLVAASLAADLEFGVDEIEDIRVAVDELAAALLDNGEHSATGTSTNRLDLEFTTDGDMLSVTGSTPAPVASEATPVVHAVAAELLGLLTDGYEVGADGGRWWFRLSRGHRVVAATDG
jgi:hypothetical protein